MGVIWSNNPATRATRIRAIHINELRAAIDAERAKPLCNLTPYPWHDNPVTRTTRIRALHFTELRDALQTVYTCHGQGALPGWSMGSAPSRSRRISARDINDLRIWFDHIDPPQGVNGWTHLPDEQYTVNDAWAADVQALETVETGAMRIKSNIRASGSPPTINYTEFNTGFGRYTARGIWPIALLGWEAYPTGTPNAALSGTTNAYITTFGDVVAPGFASNVPNVTNYIIWNEPNDTNGLYLAPDRFAALMAKCYANLKANPTTGMVYMGGLLWPIGLFTAQEATAEVVRYLTNMKTFLDSHSLGRPWDAINVHVHHCSSLNDLYTDGNMATLRTDINKVFSGKVIVGEWGPTHTEAATSGCMNNTFSILNNHFDELYYFQHPCMSGASCNIAGDAWGLTSYNGDYSIGSHCVEWNQLHSAFQNA